MEGRLAPRALESWLLSASWNMHLTEDQPTQDLVGELGLFLAEFDLGHRTDDELRTLARRLLAPVRPIV